MSNVTPSQAEPFPLFKDAIALPIFAGLTIALLLLPLNWHGQNRNIAAAVVIFNSIISNVFVFTNAIIWPRDDVTHWWDGRILCDIQVTLKVWIWVSSSVAVTCVLRSLAGVFHPDRLGHGITSNEKRRAVGIDLVLCVGLPALIAVATQIIKYGRFNILTIVGCIPSLEGSVVTLIVFGVWPPTLAFAGCVYAVQTLIRRRIQREDATVFIELSGFTRLRFYTLLYPCALYQGLSLVQGLLTIPLYTGHTAVFGWNIDPAKWDVIIRISTLERDARYESWAVIGYGLGVFFFLGTGTELSIRYFTAVSRVFRARIWILLVPGRLHQNDVRELGQHHQRDPTHASDGDIGIRDSGHELNRSSISLHELQV